jgi:hypothetical protein
MANQDSEKIPLGEESPGRPSPAEKLAENRPLAETKPNWKAKVAGWCGFLSLFSYACSFMLLNWEGRWQGIDVLGLVVVFLLLIVVLVPAALIFGILGVVDCRRHSVPGLWSAIFGIVTGGLTTLPFLWIWLWNVWHFGFR